MKNLGIVMIPSRYFYIQISFLSMSSKDSRLTISLALPPLIMTIAGLGTLL